MKKTFAIVGMGRVGFAHAAQCRMVREFDLAAVCEANEAQLAKAVEQFKVPGYRSYEQMLDEIEADFVTICTPSQMHHDMAVAAFKKGFNVFCEKPIAFDLAEAKRMKRAADKAGRVLTVNQSVRFRADVDHIRRVVQSGKIGDVFQVYLSSNNFAERTDWQIWRKFNGGQLSNWGVHLVDAVLSVMGREPTSVFARLHRILDQGDADDSFKVVIRFDNDGMGEAEYSKSLFPKPLWHVCGTKGSILVDATLPVINIKTAVATKRGVKESLKKIDFTKPPHIYSQLDHYKAMASAFRKDLPPPVTIESVLRTTAALDAARKSSETGASAKVAKTES